MNEYVEMLLSAGSGTKAEDVPPCLQTHDFAASWLEYVELRRKQYGETMSVETVRAAWAFIAGEVNPVAVVMQAINHGKPCFKQFVPLSGREHWRNVPTKIRFAVRAHRWERGRKGGVVTDTVFAPRQTVLAYARQIETVGSDAKQKSASGLVGAMT